jgi:CheY-like chemotaxis protein
MLPLWSAAAIASILSTLSCKLIALADYRVAIEKITQLINTGHKVIVFWDYSSTRTTVVEADQILRTTGGKLIIPVLNMRELDLSQKLLDELGYSLLLTLPVIPSRIYKLMAEAKNLADSVYGSDKAFSANETLIFDVNKKTSATNEARVARGVPGDKNFMPDLTGRTILVVEDNEVNQIVACEMLELTGARTRLAKNGQEAVQLMAEEGHLFDAVLMDMHMPIMDGVEATKIIREQFSREIPVIALTANATTGDKSLCMNAGMNDFLSKPIDSDRLYSVICNWLKPVESSSAKQRIIVSDPTVGHEMPSQAVPVLDMSLDMSVSESVSANQNQDVPNQDVPVPREKEVPVLGIHADEMSIVDLETVDSEAVDMDDIKRRFGSNTRIIPKVFESFVSSFAEFETLFLQAHSRGDEDEMYRLAHSLKGGAGNIGAKKLAEVATRMQDYLKENAIEAALDCLPLAITRLKKTYAYITDYLQQQSG